MLFLHSKLQLAASPRHGRWVTAAASSSELNAYHSLIIRALQIITTVAYSSFRSVPEFASDFIPPSVWPPNSPDLNPVFCGSAAGFTARKSTTCRVVTNGNTWPSAVKQWRRRLRSCVDAKSRHFGQLLQESRAVSKKLRDAACISLHRMTVCDHNPPTLQTTDRRHTVAIPRIPANTAHQLF